MFSVRNSKGFTFIEILITIVILSGVIAGTLLLLSASMLSSQYAWDTTIATSHAEYILEEMQVRDSLGILILTDWDDWLKNEGMEYLPEEKISVKFGNKQPNLLDVNVTISWVRNKRISETNLLTMITK